MGSNFEEPRRRLETSPAVLTNRNYDDSGNEEENGNDSEEDNKSEQIFEIELMKKGGGLGLSVS